MTEHSPTIVIVGGVAGGASAATRARRMNEQAEIILFEKDAHVSFANCGLPYYIGEEIPERRSLLVATPEFLKKRFRIDVRVNSEVISIDRERRIVRVRSGDEITEQSWDRLILAPGASPFVPPLDNVDAPNVLTLRNLQDTDRIKAIVDSTETRSAVVVGAGFIGLEMVEQLARRDIPTTLVELQPQVLPLLDFDMARIIEQELRDRDVALHLGTAVDAIRCDDSGRAVGVVLQNGTSVPADLIILGIGVRPNVSLAEDAGLEIGPTGGIATNAFQQTSDPDIYAVGDACEYIYGPTGSPQRVPLAGPANRAGRLAGEHAATGRCQPMAPVMGTAIVRVFGVSAGLTGLTEAAARRQNQTARSATIISRHHAGYFPGAEMITLRVVYDPDTERILGAQCVGGAGVDKRIDVIATAMHFQGTIRDLAGLDLAYAPPFGSAKDPVHLAAFVAGNECDRLESFERSDADLSGRQVLDVRTAAEVERQPLGGTDSVIHIPVDELRERLEELDPARPVTVSCAVGARAHIACRILKQHGFEVINLSGGATMRNRLF